MPPVRVGVIGVGFGATVHIPGFQSEGVEVVAVTANRQERAEAAAQQFGIPNAFTGRPLLPMTPKEKERHEKFLAEVREASKESRVRIGEATKRLSVKV